MDVHYHRGQGALGLMDLIRIYYNKFSWDKSMFHAYHKNLRCTVEDIDQLNSRMPVGRKIGASVGVLLNGNIGFFQIIEVLVNGLFHRKNSFECQF